MYKLILILFLQLNCFAYSQSSINVTEEEIYSFMNSAIFKDGRKIKIDENVLTNYYDSVYYGLNDTLILRGIDAILEGFRYGIDTLHYFIDSNDIVFFEVQIKNPVFTKWNKVKLDKHVTPKKAIIYQVKYCIPLFSLDKKTIIFGMAGPHGLKAFHWNEKTKNWDLIDVVQTGT